MIPNKKTHIPATPGCPPCPTPEAKLIGHTPDPDETVYRAALICYSEDYLPDHVVPNREKVQSLLGRLYSSGHMSTFEHASFTFAISGISRIATHQLVRHRVASFSQQSQRYVGSGGHDYPVIPRSILDNPGLKDEYLAVAKASMEFYARLVQSGVKREDARYILPAGMSSKITVTMNARELDHFFTLRMCKRAAWEIREIAGHMLEQAKEKAPLLFALSGAPCERGECREDSPCSEGAK